jgi:exo-beta-1,3-glucanase (GH17 family)
LIRSTLKTLQPYTSRVRTFGSCSGLENVPRIAREMGFGVVASAWISRDLQANEKQIAGLLASAPKYAEMLVVGSETLLRGDVTPEQLIQYIERVRAEVRKQGFNTPVTTADVWDRLKQNPKLMQACDVLFPNIYPFWENVAIENAISHLIARYNEMKGLAGSKPVIISEAGWPSDGNPQGVAVPSLKNAAFYFQSVRKWASANQIPCFYFESFDEWWKTEEPGGVGVHWGMFSNPETGGLCLKPGFELGRPWLSQVNATIEITYMPSQMGELLQGRVVGGDPNTQKLKIFIYVPNTGEWCWWVKPYFTSPYTALDASENWT